MPFTVFLIQVHPRPRGLVAPSTILLAVVIAVAGALQVRANVSLRMVVHRRAARVGRPHRRLLARRHRADWREEMVLGVQASQLWTRLQMWVWDARQQFGLAGLALALLGAVRIWSLSTSWALLLWLAFAISTAFALTYNVGDTHVFLLPGHFLLALAVAAGIGAWRDPRLGHTLTIVALMYAGWRGWDTWPAVDRHTDRRAEAQLAHLAEGLNARSALLVSKMDWQLENVLLYSALRQARSGLGAVGRRAAPLSVPGPGQSRRIARPCAHGGCGQGCRCGAPMRFRWCSIRPRPPASPTSSPAFPRGRHTS